MTVRCEPAEGGADVGAQVVLAMATRAGITPLAADRLRGDVRDALCAAGGPADLTCEVDDGGLAVGIGAPAAALEAVRAALDAHGAEVAGGEVRVRVRRAPLRSV